jgi:membrane-associated phospholipid phosphatase
MDYRLFHAFNQLAIHTAFAHGVMRLVAVYGAGVFVLAVPVAWALARPEAGRPVGPAAALCAALGTLVAVAANQPIVDAVRRLRPYAAHPRVEVLVARSTDYSFPSDHAVTAGAAALGLVLIAWQAHRSRVPAERARLLGVIAGLGVAAALVVAFSRVYVGVHYPGDVAAGLAVGAAMNTIVWLALRKPLTWFLEATSGLPMLRIAVRA